MVRRYVIKIMLCQVSIKILIKFEIAIKVLLRIKYVTYSSEGSHTG